ncbi:MAG: helix-turn-helix transcriptional regulator [Eubacterium sp.]|nr:helix-turn-helix transcriptional regulator [Eubacterium sp.]
MIIINKFSGKEEKTKYSKSNKAEYTERVKLLRERENLTQDEFLQKMNSEISLTWLSELENKKKPLSLKTALQIAKIFNVSLDWLYELKDDEIDEANKTILALQKILKISKGEFEIRKGEMKEYITADIDNKLLEFLKDLNYAEKIKIQTGMPEEAYQSWVTGINEKYNKAVENNANNKYIKYILISENDLHETIEEILEQNKPKFRGVTPAESIR